MPKEYTWEISVGGRLSTVTCVPQGNKYRIFLGDDHISDVYRLPQKQMMYGMEVPVNIGGEKCMLVVWDEVPDLVWQGRMLSRDVDYASARERRLANMEGIYTCIAILGVVFLAGLAVYAYLGQVNPDTLNNWTALLCGAVWMIGHGLYKRGKWIQQRP